MNNWQRHIFLVFTLILPTVLYATPAFEIPQLMQQLATAQHPPRYFSEQRHSDLLQDPIMLRGTLSFTEGKLLKQINEPFEELFIVEGQTLLIKRADGEQQIALSDYPSLLSFVTIFRATLLGDLATLQAHYLTELSGSREQWQLQLIPRDSQLATQLKEVTIEGDREGIQRFLIDEQNGDRSTLELGDELK